MPTSFAGPIPYLGMALLAVLFFFVLTKRGAGSKAPARRTSLAEFVQAAAEHQVSERVAREAYSLLAPRYRKTAIALSDSLGDRLNMTPAQIADMQGTLMRYTDRQARRGNPGPEVETVLQLLATVETSTVRSAPKSPTPVAATDTPMRSTPAIAPKPPTAAFVRPYRPEKKIREFTAN